MMSFTEAAFYGMGLVVLFGLVAVVLAVLHKPSKSKHEPHFPVH